MARAPGVKEKLNIIVGGGICDVYRDGFNFGSFSFWSGLIALAAFCCFLAYFHMNRDRINQMG
ncbi:uncharacterized protein LOC110179765 [Drosophila serrata]|uniref:uncharacterized protein LOC110179765 n=1 Tax=Drosophila serrata TaxID=7274 RepID=UPI000A1D0E06|nr:uncharacterized protein LOC110179765 [Drosophila serrata]KAH8362588.1 hypothetical protein KR200_005213 [Drosophila serrata]